MHSSPARRLTALGLTLALVPFLASACEDEASPAAPAPVPPAPAPPPAPEVPEPPQVAAEDVVDRETLRLFVEEAVRIASSEVSSADEAYAFLDASFRPEGQWRRGEIYIFVLDATGHSFFHPTLPHLEGQDLSDWVDLEGVRLTEDLLAAAADGGGYVEYLWDNPEVEGDEETGSPKVGYAAAVTLGDLELVFGSGIYPPVTAADVRNRGTLKSFVERAKTVVAENGPDPETAHAFLDAHFRAEGEWRHGQIYVFVHTMELFNFFHPIYPEIEGTDRSADVDLNGVRVLHEQRATVEAGGGYVEFLHDNPAIEGDEETKSRKVAYVTGMTIGSLPVIIGSGIYFDRSGEE